MSHKNFLFLFVSLALSFVLYQSSQVAAQPQILFESVPGSESVGGGAGEISPAIVRSRLVEINLSLLGGRGDARGSESAPVQFVELNLFDDQNYVAEFEVSDAIYGDGYSWQGRLRGDPLSTVIFVVAGERINATIQASNGLAFAVQSDASGYHRIDQLDLAKIAEEEIDFIEEAGLPADSDALGENPRADDGSIIDVMIVYTAQFKATQGGTTAGAELYANTAVALANTVYANSGVAQRLRLVYVGQVAYTESGSASIDLGRLQAPADNHMDHVHTLRDAYAADLVALLVDTGGCGIAKLPTTISSANAHTGFSVMDEVCGIGNRTFPHELGHNMGARHDWYVDSTNGSPTSYNHGHINIAERWRTVMGYNNRCEASDSQTDPPNGPYCLRIDYFSNPDIDIDGDPSGIPAGTDTTGCGGIQEPTCNADNARMLDASALAVSNYRQSIGLTVEITAGVGAVWVADLVNYTITVGNTTASIENNIVVTATVPANTVLLPASLSGDASYTGTGAGQVITWATAEDLAKDETLVRDFEVQAITHTLSPIAVDAAATADENGPIVDTLLYPEQITLGYTCPLVEGFESGTANPYIYAETTNIGRVRINDDYAKSGSYSLALDNQTSGGYSFAAAILQVDLRVKEQVNLTYWLRNFQDEANGADAVYVSNDAGENWVKIQPFTTTTGEFIEHTVDLDSVVLPFMEAYNKMLFKFQFYDNNPIPSDGYAIDDISIGCEPLTFENPLYLPAILNAP